MICYKINLKFLFLKPSNEKPEIYIDDLTDLDRANLRGKKVVAVDPGFSDLAMMVDNSELLEQNQLRYTQDERKRSMHTT